MSGNKRESAISMTATEMRMTPTTVRGVVQTYERHLATLRRKRKKAKQLGGGWWLLPDGTKVQGKAAVTAAGVEV